MSFHILTMSSTPYAGQGFIAQLVEHCTGIAEVMASNPVVALIFFFRLKNAIA